MESVAERKEAVFAHAERGDLRNGQEGRGESR